LRLLHSLLGVELPVIQAPMAGAQDEALAIAVSEAGGLGSMPCAMIGNAQLANSLERFASMGRAVNLNFFCHAMPEQDLAREQRWREALAPYYRELDVEPPEPSTAGARYPIDEATVDLLAVHPPKVVSFHFGLPEARLLGRIKSWATLVLASATTVEEGRWLEDNGADIVIAQGIEAGGHRGHFLSHELGLQPSTHDLVVALRASIGLPIVAAGGIAGRADVLAMERAGAVAVQVGTAYLLCPEATTSVVHRAALRRGRSAQTALTNLFSGRPARGIVNRLMKNLGPLSDLPPAFPWASQALAPLRAHAEALGRDDFSPLWSGTRPEGCREVGAAVLTRDLAGM
jgi:nitronate monooxygenase